MDEVARIGIRHGQLTAITPQPKLAKFANDVGDVLHPGKSTQRARGAIGREPQRTMGAAGSRAGSRFEPDSPTSDQARMSAASATAQLELRACIQHWIDEPIDYPLAAAAEAGAR